MNKKPNIAFFGTPERAVIALEELKKGGVMPSLIVTQPDRPQGRKMIVTPPPVKEWALREGVSVIQPEKLDADAIKTLRAGNFDFFVVVAYGKIMKSEVLNIPKYGSINLHASLLPRLRGASPVETAILTDERKTGATIILMDEEMDHGPVLLESEVQLPVWPLPAEDLAAAIVKDGSRLLIQAMDGLMKGTLKPVEQDHTKATFTKKIEKEDGLLDQNADPYQNFLKWNAYKEWPKSFFFVEKNGKKIRVIVTDASYEDGKFVIKKVIPEGKKEIAWSEFSKN